MSNPKHVSMLEDGCECWNRWRDENPDVRPDLTGADIAWLDLSRENLSAADLRRTDLREADLSWANLTSADLSGADMSGANLVRADLRLANLTGADLSRADLLGADLTEADLTGANLRDTFLNQATARQARFERAKLLRFRAAGCDFTMAKCQRADFSDYDDREPKWRELGEGEFEKLYGPLFGVEVLLDPNVDITVIGELIARLQARCQREQPDAHLAFDELRVQPHGITAQFRTEREQVDMVRACFAEEILDLLATLGRPRDEALKALAQVGWEGFQSKLMRNALPSGQLLGTAIGLTEVRDEQRQSVTINNHHYGDVVRMKIDNVSGENVVIAEQLTGIGIVSLVQAAGNEADVKAAVEQQAAQWEVAAEEDREALVQQFVEAIPKDKWAFWKNALASLVASGAAGGITHFAPQILAHLAK